MIEIKTKIHDKFSVEFKISFIVEEEGGDNDFTINTWLFIPNSLDINPTTYGKDEFYRDVKSNVRLMTPVFLLKNITGNGAVPLTLLRNATENLSVSLSKEAVADYEYHVKMFAGIVKSALRDEAMLIEDSLDLDEILPLCRSFAKNASHITESYRNLKSLLEKVEITDDVRYIYSFGDEFISHTVESHSFRILNNLAKRPATGDIKEIKNILIELIRNESDYKKDNGYVTISEDNPQNNRLIVYRHGILKKYVGSALYIKLNKKRDGQTVREIYYSIAAGIAMVFATVIAFAFQRRFGNFSGPLFAALIVSYMLKDRIKDLMRYYFAHRLGRKYFDNKAAINIKNRSVGWLKEGMDFITEEQVPELVMKLRGRSPLLEAENRIFDEKIILYRELVYINGQELEKYNEYPISGINDIMRVHINRFTLKMDDPQIPVRRVTKEGEVETIYTDKMYYINFILQLQHDGDTEYKRLRLVVTRNGILDIEEMN